jgi:hypothetical protein
LSYTARLVLRIVGIYLIPWARACDFAAYLVTRRWVTYESWCWYIAAAFMSIVLFAHFWLLCQYTVIVDTIWGETPCVCHVSERLAGYRQVTLWFEAGNILSALAACLISGFMLTYSTAAVVSESLQLMWGYPKTSLVLVFVSLVL